MNKTIKLQLQIELELEVLQEKTDSPLPEYVLKEAAISEIRSRFIPYGDGEEEIWVDISDDGDGIYNTYGVVSVK